MNSTLVGLVAFCGVVMVLEQAIIHFRHLLGLFTSA